MEDEIEDFGLGTPLNGSNFHVELVVDGVDLGPFVKTVVLEDRSSPTAANDLKQTVELVFFKTKDSYRALFSLATSKKPKISFTLTELDPYGTPIVQHVCKIMEMTHHKSIFDKGSIGCKLERFSWVVWRTSEVF